MNGTSTMNEPKPNKQLQSITSSVPVFNCIVYVLRDSSGSVSGRVANLPDLEFTASTERDLLGKIVKEFKRVVLEYSKSANGVPWIEPPIAKEPNEQTRLIPVHL